MDSLPIFTSIFQAPLAESHRATALVDLPAHRERVGTLVYRLEAHPRAILNNSASFFGVMTRSSTLKDAAWFQVDCRATIAIWDHVYSKPLRARTKLI